jgi:diguanylate cyclase (GGDEF)-like protein/putative nucleotidyltransferase with HDIG domain
MNLYLAMSIAALAAYVFLMARALRARRTGMPVLLLVYLVACSAWALTSIVLYSGYSPEHPSMAGRLLPLMGVWALVTYCHFVSVFTRRRVKTSLVAGYAFILVLVALTALQYVPPGSPYLDALQTGTVYGAWQYVFIAAVVLFAALPMILLLRSYRASTDPLGRNQVIYLMIGASLAGLTSVRMAIPSFPEYPLEHAGHLGNALVITYALNCSQLPDFKSAARKGLAYMSASLIIAPLYLAALWALIRFSNSWTAPATIATTIGMIFILPWLLMALRAPVQRTIDRILYRDRLVYRKMLLSFPRRMSNVLSLRELAEGMLRPIPKALDAPWVGLLLRSNGDFTLQFSDNLTGSERSAPVKLSAGSPVVSWLAENDKPLFRESLDAALELEEAGARDRDAIEAMDAGLLVPMHSRGQLVGILALSKRQARASYSTDDIGLLMKLGAESSTAIGNAHLHAITREQVHTDELTGLFSHGYFHQRIDEEISRCSRLGNIFSVVFLDVDLFKSYNDAFGHLAGDDILRQIALTIRGSIREIDIPFRYGGDEFAMILPESSLDDAFTVAERIRKRIESEMDLKGMALTCSMGIAAWPTNGVTREGILQAADKALYWSKQAGRNRISLASDVDPSWSVSPEFNGEQEVLSAVHALAATVDAKDPNTYGHSKKASEYCAYLAKVLGYPEDKAGTIKAAALLHDIGKIRVSDRLLTKPGPLSGEEWMSIREHPKFGVAILKHIKGLSGCLPTIQHHHERFDGSGYPAGLAGEDIPIDARILAVADAYDAMTSPRPYRRDRLAHQQAVDELARCAGSHFDPEIVRLFAALWEPLDARMAGGGVSRLTKRLTPLGARPAASISTKAGKLVVPPSNLVVPFTPR